MTIKGIIVRKDPLETFRGNPLIRFSIEGKKHYDIVAFDILARKVHEALHQGDRIEIHGRFSERHGNVQAHKILKEL